VAFQELVLIFIPFALPLFLSYRALQFEDLLASLLAGESTPFHSSPGILVLA